MRATSRLTDVKRVGGPLRRFFGEPLREFEHLVSPLECSSSIDRAKSSHDDFGQSALRPRTWKNSGVPIWTVNVPWRKKVRP
jgi:hypothetical protein